MTENHKILLNLAGINSKDIDENVDFAKRLEEMQLTKRDYHETLLR